ncbi:unnamed protein product [Blepharisma stoltei]|uniref:NADAR domain-containing protein n=1 Tax=Blepharisma stoltei TaxID=1481888 RepID=A0AAU9IZ62_9CILI|nr:unnamed protein product [Blepharisma stoltei]
MEETTIYFYHKPTEKAKPEDLYLGNFYPSPMTVHGISYPTVEHYYHSQKFSDPEIIERIRSAPTPKMAERIASEYEWNTEEWEEIKENVMRFGIFSKFKQNPELKEKLLATGTAKLVEDNHKDAFWGGSIEGSENKMGKLLMDLREQLKKAAEDLQ